MEEWRDIEGYEGLYQVSNLGNVRSLMMWNGHIYKKRIKSYLLSKTKTTTGYWKVELSKNNKKKSHKVHRLVATAFIENSKNKKIINHKDFNPLNNCVDNLEWVTQKENIDYSSKNHKLGKVKNEQLKTDIINYYKKGNSSSKVCNKFNITKIILYKLLNDNNITKHRNVFYNINLNELKKDFDKGIRSIDLSKKYNCSTKIIAIRKYQYKKGLI